MTRRRCRNRRPARDEAVDTRDDRHEWECASDEHTATPSDSDTGSCGDSSASDARPAAHSGRIMVIGFGVIRL
jgi:hypothetical protein